MLKAREAPLALPKIAPSSTPKVAMITMNRDARRQSIYDHKVIDTSLFARGSSIISFVDKPSKTLSVTAEETEKVQYENTYRTEPDIKFPHDEVEEIMHDILKNRLKGLQYNRQTSINLCKTLSQEIKTKIKEIVQRYKIITMVTIGQNKEQDVRMGSRCVWDAEWDCYASCYYENTDIFAVAVTYALFFE